jgi:hypothetical protein
MRTAALALALLVTTVQTVGWVECCCVLICKHRNDPCKKDCKDKHEATTHADCCSKKPPQPAPEEKRCSHVEPSSEVVAQGAELPPVIFDIVLELPVVALLPVPREGHETTRLFCDSRGSPPLHLLNSQLLI